MSNQPISDEDIYDGPPDDIARAVNNVQDDGGTETDDVDDDKEL